MLKKESMSGGEEIHLRKGTSLISSPSCRKKYIRSISFLVKTKIHLWMCLPNRSWCYRSTSASSSSNSSPFLLLKMMIRCRCISVGGGYRCGWRREILGRRQKADTLANYTKAGSNKDTGTKGLLRIHLAINP